MRRQRMALLDIDCYRGAAGSSNALVLSSHKASQLSLQGQYGWLLYPLFGSHVEIVFPANLLPMQLLYLLAFTSRRR